MTILYIYITLFTLYFILLALINLKHTQKVRDKYTSKDSNICVVVYATGEATTLENLLKQLKNQNYPNHHYKIYAILDRCEKTSNGTLQGDLDINFININNMEPIGKSQAYSIIAEKLYESKNLDAYVFLDAKNYVDSDFLTNINYYLTKHDVFIPMVNYISESRNLTFLENIKSTYSRYCSKFLYKSRTKLGLTNLINTDAFVIKKNILNRIEAFEFQNKTAEIKYTIELANERVKVAFIDDINVYTDIKNYDSRIPSLSQRINIFWNNVTHAPNFTSQEYICSLIQPNWLMCIVAYSILLIHSHQFPFWVNYSNILIAFIILTLVFCGSLICSKLYAKEHLYLFAYPIYSIGHILKNLPPIRFTRNLITKTNHKHAIETMRTAVFVTDGTNIFQCELEFISDDGLAKVKFINNGKTYITKNNHLRMVDALRELTDKLADYGLSLKICQCCKYFQPIVDGSTNMLKGCCNCQFKGRVDGDIIPTLVWNTCPNFEEQNIVPLF